MPIPVMVNGLPGKMATLLANAIAADKRFKLADYSFTGPEINDLICHVGQDEINLIHISNSYSNLLANIRDVCGQFLVADFTQPSAVNPNAEFYCRLGWPFVMGTTGGDREALETTVRQSSVAAVVAPNMAKQVVLFQAMMRFAAENFPQAFAGYRLNILESHQQAKKDASGTAKALIADFNALGVPFKPGQITMVRDPELQRSIGVPDAALTGHGWHDYVLRSAEGDVLFKFTHNINGRDVYIRGTIDALLFLHRMVLDGRRGLFSMIDVLKNQSP